MKKNVIFAAFVAAATFVASENANAQTAEQSVVANRLAKKATAYWKSEGEPKADATAVGAAAQKTYFFNKKRVRAAVEGENNGRPDSLIIRWDKDVKREATSGWAFGVTGGVIQMAENFSPTLGLDASFAGKLLLLGATAEAGISKYNGESSKAGKSFVAPVFSARIGIIPCHFSLGGVDNRGWLAIGYEFKYILDKNENLASERVYETPSETITESGYFAVEGNSMCHTGFIEARFSPKHFGSVSIGVKAYGGVYNRYYQEGSRRKAMFGASVSLYFSGAKKRSDADVIRMLNEAGNGDYTIMNEAINQIRAKMQ
jgi:hypothetical protein